MKRDYIEGLVRRLMEGEEGKEMRKNALGWKKKIEKATSPKGSSVLDLDNLINQVLIAP